MRRLVAGLLIGVLPLALGALEVDREELESQITRTVEFQNYQGPYDRIDTLEEIRGIGAYMARGVTAPLAEVDYFGRYRIVHAVDPDRPDGLDADILFVLDGARVDHIDNIRRILAAYLEEAYSYSRSQAWLISEFVTIYNAIYRGDLDFFAGRYKRVVLDHVHADAVGIATHYRDWPGRTQLVTPLRSGAAPGVIGSIDALALTDERVVEELRTRPDMALDQRRDMVDLIEESIERDETRVEREEAEIAAEREAVDRERERILAERRELREAEERELEERAARVAEREETVVRERDDVERRIDELREIRDQIAEDTRTVMERAPVAMAEEIRETLFLEHRMQHGRPLGRVVIIDAGSATILRRSDNDRVTSRSLVRWGRDILVIAEQNGAPRLMRMNASTLEQVHSGSAELFAESALVAQPDRGEIFAVVRDGNQWYLGKFNSSLALLERSTVAVDPFTYIAPGRDVIFVQAADGTIIGLSLEDLSR